MILFMMMVISGLFCTQTKMDGDTVAIVGNEKISQNDLLTSYELLPHYAPSKKGLDGLQAHLDLLIEKKLFAQEGRRRGYAKDPIVRRAVDWYTNEALRTALYQDEIESKIEASDQELLDFYANQNTQVKVKHLFAKTREQIEQLQDALKQNIPWEELARFAFEDSVMASNGGDLGWIGYGQMDEAFEDSAFSLKIGEISEPVRSKYGYHLIKLENIRRNVMLSKDDFNLNKENLKASYVKRQEKILSSEFISEFMAQKDLKLMNETFNVLVDFIGQSVIDNQLSEAMLNPVLRDEELDTLSNDLRQHYNDILFTFDGGEWTIEDFLNYLSGIPRTNRPRIDSPARFRRDLGILMRDYFLNEEAKKRGLQNDPYVKKQRKHWEDEFIFSHFWNDIISSLDISNEQAQEYYQSHISRYWIPEKVHVQEILVRTRQEAESIRSRLKQGDDFSELARRYSLRSSATENGGDLGFIVWGQYGDVSKTAFELDVGEVSEPIELDAGYSIIKLLGKQKQRAMTYDEARDEVLVGLRRELNNDVYDQWTEQLWTKANIIPNDSLLIRLADELGDQDQVSMPGIKRMN